MTPDCAGWRIPVLRGNIPFAAATRGAGAPRVCCKYPETPVDGEKLIKAEFDGEYSEGYIHQMEYYAYQLWGKKKVLQLAGSFICIGFFVSALLGGVFESMAMKVIINSLGFMLVGLGISCIVPTLYSFVGAKSKTPVSIALTILSSISFIGSLIAPLLIGAISQAFDIRIAYMIIGILGGCIVLIVSFSSAFDIQESGDKPE